MEFLRLLEIDRSLLAPEAEKSLLLADRVWCEEGCPREPSRLVAVLEKILQRCLSSGLWYAPILLRRKKGLERGTWRPPAYTSGAGESPSLPATASPADAGKERWRLRHLRGNGSHGSSGWIHRDFVLLRNLLTSPPAKVDFLAWSLSPS